MFKGLAGGAVVVALPLAQLLLVSTSAMSATTTADLTGGPSALVLSDIPPAYLVLYLDAAQAAQDCPGACWPGSEVRK
jgi:hypothetical protein